MKDEFELIANNVCQIEKFNLIKFVGGGACKKVYKVSNSNGTLALKIIDSKASLKRTEREIKAILQCNHQNISKIYKMCSLKQQTGNIYYFIEEFLDRGNLSEYIKENGLLNYNQMIEIGNKIIDVINHISERGLVHRDIKPDNIMFKGQKYNPVLVDFGIVRDLKASSITQSWAPSGPATPYFASPEQLNNQKQLIDWRTDQFSLGITLSFAGFGFHPYQYSGENQFDVKTVERVSERGQRNKEILKLYKANKLECLEVMTRPWPVERYRFCSQLYNEWNKQRG
jgi:serine/threonine protein kinase